MKKATFITIIAALLLIVSCNVDSEHGIYYKVATSQASSGINIIKALGFSEGSPDIHYFLTDDGICTTSNTQGDTRYIEGSQGKNIRGAYLQFSSMYYYYSNAEGKVYELHATGESELVPLYANGKFEVSSNGFAYNKEQYSFIDAEVINDATISNPRFSGSSMLSMEGTTKALIYKASNEAQTITGLTASATGFAVSQDEEYYYIFNGKNIYKVEVTPGEETALGDAIYSGLGTAPTGGYTAVEYSIDDDDFLLVRTASGFTKIDVSSRSASTVSFLSDLNDVVVIDMYVVGDGKIAIVTYENGIHIADMVNSKLSDDIL